MNIARRAPGRAHLLRPGPSAAEDAPARCVPARLPLRRAANGWFLRDRCRPHSVAGPDRRSPPRGAVPARGARITEASSARTAGACPRGRLVVLGSQIEGSPCLSHPPHSGSLATRTVSILALIRAGSRHRRRRDPRRALTPSCAGPRRCISAWLAKLLSVPRRRRPYRSGQSWPCLEHFAAILRPVAEPSERHALAARSASPAPTSTSSSTSRTPDAASRHRSGDPQAKEVARPCSTASSSCSAPESLEGLVSLVSGRPRPSCPSAPDGPAARIVATVHYTAWPMSRGARPHLAGYLVEIRAGSEAGGGRRRAVLRGSSLGGGAGSRTRVRGPSLLNPRSRPARLRCRALSRGACSPRAQTLADHEIKGHRRRLYR
jgi:hypothetical protein